ncbi:MULTISPECIES: DsbA family protein [unclassified Exiguobacterium]|uniref:DsbA family protein n=1 Tax=unclassified Exiguobacterium TaxID=2644629 RepID=UPI00103CEFEE|nr:MULTISPECIES: DsbA family protein [unclassified Exiguobacterium]TCI53597.1 DsbA family protein [Exiguobacterium sp. SH5S13]TCI66436.1 DsbA family protein [Exiguobacterium sp. SH3S1]
MKQNQALVVGTLIAVALIAVVVVLLNRPAEQAETAAPATSEHVPTDGQPTLGEADAPVSIVEFGDYKCPSCKQWGETIYPQLKADYVDTGDASFSYINVLFHGQESILASLASESVYKQDPDAFWDFHKALYDAQPASQQHDEAWVTVERLKQIAGETTSVDMAKFEDDLSENSSVLEQVSLDDGLVKEYGVQFTPSIMINGVMLEDPFDYKAIERLIEQGAP